MLGASRGRGLSLWRGFVKGADVNRAEISLPLVSCCFLQANSFIGRQIADINP